MCDDTLLLLIDGEYHQIDACIYDLVEALQVVGTCGSCSGHGVEPGFITLKDGRRLVILPEGFVYSDWPGVSWLDLWRQLKARVYRVLWYWGFIESYQNTFTIDWPRKLIDVRRF